MHTKIISILITVLLILTTWIAAVTAEQNQEENITSQPEQYLASTGPIADAGGPYYGVVHTPIQFDGSASYHPNGTIISYEWFCGDGEVETGQTASHRYTTPGTYTLTLTVKDGDDNCGTDTTQVIVSDDQPPEAFFLTPKQGSFYFRNKELFSTNGTTLVLGPCNITIEASDDVEVQRVEIYIDGQRKHIDFDEPYSYNWKFGSFSHQIKAIIYDTSNHDITIEQTVFKWRLHPILMLQTLSLLKGNQNKDLFSGDGQQNSPSLLLLSLLKFVLKSNQFDNQQDNDVLAQLLEKILQNNKNDFNLYQFLNNHPLISKRLQKNHKFIYNLIMLSNGEWSLNNKDQRLSLFQNRAVLKTLATISIIKYVYEKTQQLPSLLPSKEPTGFESFYQWVRDHPYLILLSALLFIQLLTRLSNTYSDSENDDFNEPTENRVPHANAGGPYNQEKGKSVMFSAADSYDEDGTIVSFEWDFGDGYTDSGETVEHRYDSTGTYLVTLTVTDEDGATSNDTVTVFITAEKTQPLNKDEQEDMTFWIVSGGLSSLLLAGVAILQFRRRLFE
ncbi:MAG: PKD domain-containing protein [Thermoplasmatota archaeon]